jgi:hypothetical protein
MDQRAGFRVSAYSWSFPEQRAEVDLARDRRVHISVCVRFSAGAVKGINGELAVGNLAEMV